VRTSIKPGQIRLDIDQRRIHPHGGSLLEPRVLASPERSFFPETAVEHA
jgi:hypothetical protein